LATKLCDSFNVKSSKAFAGNGPNQKHKNIGKRKNKPINFLIISSFLDKHSTLMLCNCKVDQY